MSTKIILGIDPGSRIAGLGVLIEQGSQIQYHSSKTIILQTESTLGAKLHKFYVETLLAIDELRPDCVAIESLFHHKNVRSAMILAHARSVAILAATIKEVPIFEYSPLEVKQSMTGYGRADKDQVFKVMRELFPPLKLKALKSSDESDAVAIAYCHIVRAKFKSMSHLTESPRKAKTNNWDDWLAQRKHIRKES